MFFTSFDGWKDFGKDREILLAHFTKVADAKRPAGKYNYTSLNNMLNNPPAAFEDADRALVQTAIDAAPAPHRSR